MFKSVDVKEGPHKKAHEEGIKELVSKREIAKKIDEVSIVRAQGKESAYSNEIGKIASFEQSFKKKIEELDKESKERSIGLAVGGVTIGTFLGIHASEIIGGGKTLFTYIADNATDVASQILGPLALPVGGFVASAASAAVKVLETIDLATQLPFYFVPTLGESIALLAVGGGALAFAFMKTGELDITKNEFKGVLGKFRRGLESIKNITDEVKHLGDEIVDFAEEIAKTGGRKGLLAGSVGLGIYLGSRLYGYLMEMPGLDAFGTFAPHNLPSLVFLASSTALAVWEIGNAARRYVKNNDLKNSISNAFSKLNKFKERFGGSEEPPQ